MVVEWQVEPSLGPSTSADRPPPLKPRFTRPNQQLIGNLGASKPDPVVPLISRDHLGHAGCLADNSRPQPAGPADDGGTASLSAADARRPSGSAGRAAAAATDGEPTGRTRAMPATSATGSRRVSPMRLRSKRRWKVAPSVARRAAVLGMSSPRVTKGDSRCARSADSRTG